MERAGIFEFSFGGDNRLFYTRRIGLHEGDQVNIIVGGRLAGRIADWDIGVLNVQTGAEADLAAENARLRKELATARMEREILRKATAYFAKESLPGTRS